MPTTLALPLSQRLHSKLNLLSSGLALDLQRFWSSEELPRRYPLLLQELYTVSHGASFQMKRVQAEAARRPDEASQRVADYLTRHIEEEKGHWDWLLDDLEALGFDRAVQAGRRPSVYATAILGCGYVWALDHHPACYLGHLLVFEGNPYPVPFLEAVIARTGLPKTAFSFFLDHARLDPTHAADLRNLLDSLAFDGETEAQITLCALHTQALTHDLLQRVLEAPLT